MLLVTDSWHMLRAVGRFRSTGLEVVAAPTPPYEPKTHPLVRGLWPSEGELEMSGYALHELVGSLWYVLRYGTGPN